MIVCQDLSKHYGGKYALSGLNFTLQPGHIYALLGPNGSGKSTWMKILAGLVKPSAGKVYVDDHQLSFNDKRQIAYMPTEPYFYSYMTAIQAAKYYQDFFEDFNMEKFRWTMQQMGLDPSMKVRAYSTGMMAKFKVALNVSRNPRLLMLDEPLNGIDMLAREEVTAGIMQGIDRNSIVMISSHLIEDLERIADYVIFLREGQMVVHGPVASFREQYGKSMTDMYREIFGAAVLFGMPGQMPYGAQGMQGYGPQGMQGYGPQGMQGYGPQGMPGYGPQGYVPPQGYGPQGTSQGQPGQYAAPGRYAATGQYGAQDVSQGQPGQYGAQGMPQGQPGQYAATGQYGPQGQYGAQDVSQGQPGQYGAQDMPQGQPGQYAAPGQYGPQGQYGAQDVSQGQPGQYAAPGATQGQPGQLPNGALGPLPIESRYAPSTRFQSTLSEDPSDFDNPLA